MNQLKIMFVEDAEDQQESFIDTVKVFNRHKQKNNLKVEYKIAKNPLEASDTIDASYDGAIIDLKLDDDVDGGNRVVRELYDSFTRIPIIFVTAYADLVTDHPSVIKIRRRDDGTYKSDILFFQKIQDTGLTRIMGGRGLIEEQLREVFVKNLLLQIDTWISYGETYKDTDPGRTEKALLRHTLNHLYQLLEDNEHYFPEEVYIHPPISDKITTGSIVKAENRTFIVLNPACDLVPRGESGVPNTDQILLVEIESIDKVLDGSKSKSKVNELCSNKRIYYHWLPETNFFEGGILNFRKITTYHIGDFDKTFQEPEIQISPFFIKDIVSRFSSYYARQGQPDIDKKSITAFIEHYTS